MKKITKRITLALGLIGAMLLSGCDTPTSDPSTGSSSSFVTGTGHSSDGSSIDITGLTDSKYPGLDFSTYGETFRNKLASLITGKTTTYNGGNGDCKDVGMKAMAWPNENSSTYIPFYFEAKDSNAATSAVSNREHCWPKSRGGNLIETDPIVIRPTIENDNSTRGDKFYGNTTTNEYDPGSKHSNGSSYLGARGESARVILYAACRYYAKGLSLSNSPSDSKTLKTMGTLKTLLKWNMEYQPTEWEKTVNARYEKMGFACNPFVLHPEYANFIWDNNGLRTTPYVITAGTGSTSSSEYVPPVTSSSDSPASSSEEPVTDPSVTQGNINESFKKTFTISDWPSSYGTNNTFASNGVSFSATNCGTGYTAGAIQMKKDGSGSFYNTFPIIDGDYKYIAIKPIDRVTKPVQSVPVVAAGEDMMPVITVTPVASNGYYWYDISNKPFFKISSGSDSASYITELHLA